MLVVLQIYYILNIFQANIFAYPTTRNCEGNCKLKELMYALLFTVRFIDAAVRHPQNNLRRDRWIYEYGGTFLRILFIGMYPF